MRALARGNGHDEVDGEGYPNHCDQDVDGPFQFGIFFALSQPQRQSNNRQYDNQVPSPEGEPGHLVAPQPDAAGALHTVKGGGHEHTAAEGEDHCVGV